MKKIFIAVLIAGFGVVCFAAKPKVNRVDANTVVDLSGYWNDSDVRIVCESLLASWLSKKQE